MTFNEGARGEAGRVQVQGGGGGGGGGGRGGKIAIGGGAGGIIVLILALLFGGDPAHSWARLPRLRVRRPDCRRSTSAPALRQTPM